MTTKLHRPAAAVEPLPDPPKRTDMQQLDHLAPAYTILRAHFSKREDVLVAGDGYLIESRGSVRDWAGHFVPDCVVAFGVDPKAIRARNGYVISEVGKPPEFVLEIASETTAPRDVTVKREGYAALGVSEYWRFDGSGEGYYPQPVAGDLLVEGSYTPVEITRQSGGETRGYSPSLSLYLCADDGVLRFWDPATGQYLPTLRESKEREARAVAERDAERGERERALAERDRERAERDRERAARIESERRNVELEAEVARLRERLGRS